MLLARQAGGSTACCADLADPGDLMQDSRPNLSWQGRAHPSSSAAHTCTHLPPSSHLREQQPSHTRCQRHPRTPTYTNIRTWQPLCVIFWPKPAKSYSGTNQAMTNQTQHLSTRMCIGMPACASYNPGSARHAVRVQHHAVA
jgi:hypothetical protein